MTRRGRDIHRLVVQDRVTNIDTTACFRQLHATVLFPERTTTVDLVTCPECKGIDVSAVKWTPTYPYNT